MFMLFLFVSVAIVGAVCCAFEYCLIKFFICKDKKKKRIYGAVVIACVLLYLGLRIYIR